MHRIHREYVGGAVVLVCLVTAIVTAIWPDTLVMLVQWSVQGL